MLCPSQSRALSAGGSAVALPDAVSVTVIRVA